LRSAVLEAKPAAAQYWFGVYKENAAVWLHGKKRSFEYVMGLVLEKFAKSTYAHL